MAIDDFKDKLVDFAKEISKEWAEAHPDEPMDCDDVEDCSKVIRIWLDYYQGNITIDELYDKLEPVNPNLVPEEVKV